MRLPREPENRAIRLIESSDLDVNSIEVYESEHQQALSVRVSKRVCGEPMGFGLDISYHEMVREDGFLDFRIDRFINEVKQLVEKEETDQINYGLRSVRVSVYSGGWAKCNFCGEKVTFDIDSGKCYPISPGEFTEPIPKLSSSDGMPYSDLDITKGKNRAIAKMYLIGRLREECQYDCPNSKFYLEDAPMSRRKKK